MSDFKEQLIGVIAAKVITQGHMSDLPMPQGFGAMRWTGWKNTQNDIYPHAQIIWFMDRKPLQKRVAYYVDLPSMKHGSIEWGSYFDIGFSDSSHFLSEQITPDEIREWFKEGFALLMDDVLNDNPWLLESPIKST